MSSRSKIHILLVDDEPTIHQAIRLVLTECVVKGSVDIATALQTLENEIIDVVLVDMHLPDGTGNELIAQINKLANTPGCIVLTAYPTAESAIASLRMQVSDYLTKPFHLDELTAAVDLAFARTMHRRRNAGL